MEKASVTGAELRAFYPEQTQLGRVFLDVESDLRAEKKVVCRYIVNGLSLDEKEEARFSQIPLSQVESLEYLAEYEEVLTRDVLEGWLGALPELIQASENLSTRILAGQKDGLIKAVHDLVENGEYLVASLDSIFRLRDGDEEQFHQLAKLLRQSLSEAVRHLEKRDFVLLAQVIEYDFTHGLEEWRLALTKFLEREGNLGAERGRHSEENDPVGGR